MLITATALDSLSGQADDQELRRVTGAHLTQIAESGMKSGKITDADFLTDRRGVFFLANIDSAEELYELLGPEVYGFCKLEVAPIADLQAGGAIFAQWAQQGR